MNKKAQLKQAYETPYVEFAALIEDVLADSDPMSKDKDNWLSEDALLGGGM